jgi:hypothetical protein
VGIQVDLRTREVRSLTEAGEGDGVSIVTVIPKPPGNRLPAPSSKPGTTD